MIYAAGSLVKAHGREWVVLPESEEDLLVLRPLGGTEDEVAGVYLPLEPVEPKPHCPKRCPPSRVGRFPPTTIQLERWEETSMTSTSSLRTDWEW